MEQESTDEDGLGGLVILAAMALFVYSAARVVIGSGKWFDVLFFVLSTAFLMTREDKRKKEDRVPFWSRPDSLGKAAIAVVSIEIIVGGVWLASEHPDALERGFWLGLSFFVIKEVINQNNKHISQRSARPK